MVVACGYCVLSCWIWAHTHFALMNCVKEPYADLVNFVTELRIIPSIYFCCWTWFYSLSLNKELCIKVALWTLIISAAVTRNRSRIWFRYLYNVYQNSPVCASAQIFQNDLILCIRTPNHCHKSNVVFVISISQYEPKFTQINRRLFSHWTEVFRKDICSDIHFYLHTIEVHFNVLNLLVWL